jgi:hypothetical protein
MSDISSLFIVTSVLGLGGLGLYMLKSDDDSESEKNIEKNINKDENKDEDKENESEWFESNKESKNTKTRRVRKKLKSTRRRM